MSVIAALLLALIAFGGAGSKGPRPAEAKASAPKTDVCNLLTTADIQRVHKTKVVASKPSQSPAKGFTYSQCFYQAEKFPDSVILTVTLPDKAHPAAAREFWEETIVKASQTVLAEKGDPTTKASAKQQRHKPKAVANVGDEAWWVGDRNVGALYVLKGERFLRISVGGKDTQEEKAHKAAALARSVLARLG